MEILKGLRLKGHKAVYLANEDSNRRLQERNSRIAPDPDDGVIFFGGISNDKPISKDANALLPLSAIIKNSSQINNNSYYSSDPNCQ